jgi:GNAT superfamily N-acetyltransferase
MTPAWGTLAEADLPEAAEVLAGEGWTFTPRELARLLATAPGLSPTLRDPGGRLVALLTAARHGALAWIGNVAVLPAQRGKGLGEALVQEALRRIDAAGVRSVGLVSVPTARTLYARAGFVAQGEVATFTAHHERPTHRPRAVDVLMADSLPEVAALDQAAWGADRSALLALLVRDYPDTGVLLRDDAGAIQGFAFSKPGERGSEVGPVVARTPTPDVLGLLLDGALGFRLQGEAAMVECSVPAAHPSMGALLRARGFAERPSRGTLMVRGPTPAWDLARAAALAGLEKG